MASNNNNPWSSMSDTTKEKLYAALMDRSPEPSTKGNLNLRNVLVECGDPEIIIEKMTLYETKRQKIECIMREKGPSMAMVELLKAVVDNKMIYEFHSALIASEQKNLANNIFDKFEEMKERWSRTF